MVSTPSSISARAAVGVPSPSNTRERRPRTRRGSSWISMPAAKMRAPSLSFRNDVPRATEAPLIAPDRCPSRPPETRGS